MKQQTFSDYQHAVAHDELANAIRFLAIDAVEAANSGHPGMPMGMADIATVLFSKFLKFDPKNPKWANRDRFVLSNGHGSMLLYGLLYLTGYPDMTLEEIKKFRQLGYITAGHPEYGHATGIETTTGPLGQGIANAVGMAMAEKLLAARVGEDTIDYHTYVFTGDGCLMEGLSQEAISLAGHLKLNKLIVLFDDNEITIDGATSLSTSEDHIKRFEAANWSAERINGHNKSEIEAAIARAHKSKKPTLIACKTTIGYGAPTKAGTSGSHGAPLGADEIKGTRDKLKWIHTPFEIPDDVLNAWREIGARGQKVFSEWQAVLSKPENKAKKDLLKSFEDDATISAIPDVIADFKRQIAAEKPKKATRQSSSDVLELIAGLVPNMIGGSADLTHSNLTKAKTAKPITADDFSGNYVYYGIREHGMAAAMNGLALSNFIPFGGAFLTFSDYCRPSIRLAALMNIRSIYVMTHDSIGLGEDGPTHQPVEHLASLRAIPNLLVMRPADGIETAECWELALKNKNRPSVLVLSRQGLPTLRDDDKENWSARGGYLLRSASAEPQVTIIATGSEVSVAIDAMNRLMAEGIPSAVVSMPCWRLFEEQPLEYRSAILPADTLKVAIEAGVSQGWERFIGKDGIFVGMTGFGASGNAADLYKHFGITAEKIVEAVKKRL